MSYENIVELDDTTWEATVEKGDKPVVVMFYSDTCPYCKQIEPYFFEYANDFKGKIVFARINIVNSLTIPSRYGVMGTLTFKFFCKSRPVYELVGAMDSALLKKAIVENLEHGEKCVKNATWLAPDLTSYA